MRLQINNTVDATVALSNGVHPNRVMLWLSVPILPPMPLGHALQLVAGVDLPLAAIDGSDVAAGVGHAANSV